MKHKNISPLDEIPIPFSALLRSPTSVVRPSTIYSFNFFSRTAWWIFMTLGREKELVVPYWCCYFSCESAKGYIQGVSNISHMFINNLWNENSFQILSSQVKLAKHKKKKVIEFHYRSRHRWSFTLERRTAMVQSIKMVSGAISMSLICLWQRYFTLCTENVIIQVYIAEWRYSKECMCHLQNITMKKAWRWHQENVTTGQTHRRTYKQTSEEVVPMYRYVLQAKQ